MMLPSRIGLPALLAGVLLLGLGLQGCVATTVAGATLGVAGAAAKTTVKVTGKVAGGTVHLAARAVGHAVKGSSASQSNGGRARQAPETQAEP
jgi:hypothetical protein